MTTTSTDALLRQLYARLQDVKAENERLKAGRPNVQMAIIGIGCRLPGGVDTLQAFQRQLADGIDWVNHLPTDRVNAFGDAAEHWRGSLVDGIEQFDAACFDMQMAEAAEVDPQQRLLLEASYRALEDARRPIRSLRGHDVGVFVGMSSDDYQGITIHSGRHEHINPYNALGTARSVAAGRISYTFDFTGPALQVDTACSSSLMAIHLACQSLSQGECSMALAGGVNLMLGPEAYVGRDALGALSRTGRCHTFSDEADGYARGEGCGMVLLKPLARALADGDRIHAVIHGSAANHDGRSNGLTAPSGAAQRRLLADVLQRAGVAPASVSYAETHGTGTRLGDPIEVHSIGDVLAGDREQPLWLGALKSRLGHLEAAAGVAAVIRVCALLAQEALVPDAAIARLNPLIDWDAYKMKVVQQTVPWPARGDAPRLAILNAFGLSGTNVSLVIGDPPRRAAVQPTAQPSTPMAAILSVSGKSEVAVLRELKAFEEAIRGGADIDQLQRASCLHRDHGNHRRAFDASESDALLAALASARCAAVPACRAQPLSFGLGAVPAHAGAALRALMPRVAVFREAVVSCLPATEAERLMDALPPSPQHEGAWRQILDYALARTWMALGLQPEALVFTAEAWPVAACLIGLQAPDALWSGQSVALRDATSLAARPGAWRPALRLCTAEEVFEIAQGDAEPVAGLAHDQAADILWLGARRHLPRSVPEGLCTTGLDGLDTAEGDEAGAGAIASAWRACLANLYERGVDLDFKAVFTLAPADTKVALPPRIFERQTLWTAAQPLARQAPSSGDETVFSTHWWPSVPAAGQRVDRLILMGDPRHWADADAAIRAHAASTEVVADLAQLCTLDPLPTGCTHVLDLRHWASVDDQAFDPADAHTVLAGQLATLQALAERRDLRYWVAVPGTLSSCALRHGALAGFLRSATHELPRLVAGFATVEPGGLPTLVAALPGMTAFERCHAGPHQLHVQRLQRVPPPTSGLTDEVETALRAGGAVWITGGLGGLGLALAKAMAEAGVRDIVLTGRRAGLDPDTALALARLRALGATVHVGAVDVADEAAVTAWLRRFGQDLPRLACVVHAAGISEQADLAAMTPAHIDRMLSAKVRGAWNLHRACQGLDLANMVFYSSISAIWGSAGLSHYAAANAFLDALAQMRATQGLPASVVNWGPWAQVGMAAREHEVDLEAWGLIPLQAEEVAGISREIVLQPGLHRVVCHLDVPRFRQVIEARQSLPLLEPVFMAQASGPQGASSDAQGQAKAVPLLEGLAELATLTPKVRRKRIGQVVARMVASALRMSDAGRLSHTAPLHELGIDSLMAVDLSRRLSGTFGCTLPNTLIFDYPTVVAVATYIDERIHPAGADEALSDAEEAALLAAIRQISLDEPPLAAAVH